MEARPHDLCAEVPPSSTLILKQECVVVLVSLFLPGLDLEAKLLPANESCNHFQAQRMRASVCRERSSSSSRILQHVSFLTFGQSQFCSPFFGRGTGRLKKRGEEFGPPLPSPP